MLSSKNQNSEQAQTLKRKKQIALNSGCIYYEYRFDVNYKGKYNIRNQIRHWKVYNRVSALQLSTKNNDYLLYRPTLFT